ncbi:hypothetical protein SAMN04489844_2479 [Nocardioides exalbidus]|uniref:CU044_5270 family protein n=1 Tax=Nocardioides exalbidus TaxID=402596 RepID=A0A1H4TAW0_9ACTN|nr:CU044_5270 family protein [Nocardioides exalbidus]SEC53606.1 hypothetical protein SAMN04489844_2479 [Nocardioides exalbidus]
MNDLSPDLVELRGSHPAPHDIALSSEHRDRLRSRVDTAIGRHETRRRLALAVAAPATVLACASAVAAVAVLALTGPSPATTATVDRPVLASAAAVRVLDRAADRALATTAPVVREDQFVYTRSATLTNEGTFGGAVSLGDLHTREIWLGQDPGPFGWRDDVIRELGQDWPLESGGPSPAGARRPTYAWLAALPTDPGALLDELEHVAVPVDGQSQDQAVFDVVGNLLSEQLLPPPTAAALYRAVTLVDGVEVDRGATDALGRRGVGISRADERFHTRTTWIFDSETFELRGTKWFFTHADGSPDTLFGATAVLETAVVDRAGQEPGSST